MSEYQKRKAQALLLQQEKEEQLKRELAEKVQREKEQAKADEERRKRQEAALKEARRLELTRANDLLHRKEINEQRSREGKPSLEDEDLVKSRLAYDPFAEDERPLNGSKNGSKTTSSIKSKRPTVSRERSHPGPSKPSTSKATKSAATANKGISPPPLSRKEKAAQDFARKAMKSSADSLFSARAYADSPPPSRSNTTMNSGYNKPVVSASRSLDMASNFATAKTTGKVVSMKNRKIDGLELRKLAPDRDKWDRRTIDEIQIDLRKAKGKGRAGSEGEDDDIRGRSDQVGQVKPVNGGRTTSNMERQVSNPGRSKSPLKKEGKSLSLSPLKLSATKLPTTSHPIKSSHPPRSTPNLVNRKRPRSPSSSSSSSSSSSIRYPKPSKGVDHSLSHIDVSATIQALFRRPGQSAIRRYDDDDDSGSDMEAGMSDLEAEERETARIARLEDEADERRERERKEAKERLKKEKDKERMRK